MENITLEQFRKMPEYQKFIQQNPSTGTLKVQVFTADQAIPLPDTEIFITKQIGNYNVLFFEGVTDSSGIIDNIVLPTPVNDLDLKELIPPSYETYQLVASNNKLREIKQYQISMYGGIKVLQYIKMHVTGGENSGK